MHMPWELHGSCFLLGCFLPLLPRFLFIRENSFVTVLFLFLLRNIVLFACPHSVLFVFRAQVRQEDKKAPWVSRTNTCSQVQEKKREVLEDHTGCQGPQKLLRRTEERKSCVRRRPYRGACASQPANHGARDFKALEDDEGHPSPPSHRPSSKGEGARQKSRPQQGGFHGSY